MLSVLGAPLKYIQGADATQVLGAEMAKLGLTGSVLIVAGHSPQKLLGKTWTETFNQAGMKHTVYSFTGECSREEIERAKEAARAAKADVIVGAGGGKVLDTARAVADELNLPIVNCPTVASSDAPCSALSVVYTAGGEFDRYIFYRNNPNLVLVDTAVIAKSPPRLLVAGMGDALATWFEAQTVVNAGKANQLGGATTITASAMAELCYKTLLNDGAKALDALRHQTVTPELERLVEANTLLSGVGFESGGLAVAHSVHNGLTIAPQTHNFMHGEKVAFGLMVQLALEEKAKSLIDEVTTFCLSVGLPITLADVGLHELAPELLNKIAERTVAEGETCHNEPFPVTAKLISDSIKKADSIGREAKSTALAAR